jgi:hypothetical protein
MAVNTVSGAADPRRPPDARGGASDHPRQDASRFTVAADISALASALSRVPALRQRDPDEFKQVMRRIARALAAEATRIDGTAARTMGELVARFQHAAETGDELVLQPAEAPEDHGALRLRLQSYACEPGDERPSLLLRVARVVERAMRQTVPGH